MAFTSSLPGLLFVSCDNAPISKLKPDAALIHVTPAGHEQHTCFSNDIQRDVAKPGQSIYPCFSLVRLHLRSPYISQLRTAGGYAVGWTNGTEIYL